MYTILHVRAYWRELTATIRDGRTGSSPVLDIKMHTSEEQFWRFQIKDNVSTLPTMWTRLIYVLTVTQTKQKLISSLKWRWQRQRQDAGQRVRGHKVFLFAKNLCFLCKYYPKNNPFPNKQRNKQIRPTTDRVTAGRRTGGKCCVTNMIFHTNARIRDTFTSFGRGRQ